MSGLGPDSSVTDMSQGPALLAVTVVTTAAALITSVLRFCVRIRISRKVVLDDYFLGVAMVLGFIGMVFAMLEGTHQQSLASALEFDYLSQPWLDMASTLSKVSICLFFLRLVSRVKLWRIVLLIQISVLLVLNLAYCITTLLQCRPLDKLWDSGVEGQCWSSTVQRNIDYVQGAFDILSSLFVTLFPIILIQDLNIKKSIRWPFYVLSFMSISIALLSVVRTYNVSLTDSEDEYTFRVICTILAVLEQNFGIIAANVLPIASLFSKHIRPISQALSQAASARENLEAASIFTRSPSRASDMTKASRRKSISSEFTTEAPRAESSHGNDHVESWPLGIIKTVSVEVVQERAVNDRDMDISDLVRADSRQNWDSKFP
ncbi:hypothetical protein BX600DRAFT_545582 [Xylariales sp. PMI_506]|nr:hypothetical protein BX600DRAFT_545582 [Xylariales sp. PMI_506]